MTANFRSKNTAEACAALAIVLSVGQGIAAQTTSSTAVTPPPGYVIGVDDKLAIAYWKDKDMSAEVIVRPDGKISLPLLNEVVAAGKTPGQLREDLVEESRRYVEDANITVVVLQINSRRVYITGEVNKPGPYPLAGPMTVLQLIAMAGGLREYANGKKIIVMRTENNNPVSHVFNYQDVIARRNLKQNIELRPGDTVVVP